MISTLHGVVAEEEKILRCKISTNTMYNTLKMHINYAHTKRRRAFSERVGCEPYERSLCERTFMSEPFMEKHAISAELSNVNQMKFKRKSHLICRRDREPSRIPIRSLKRFRNKSRKVREFVYAHILSWGVSKTQTSGKTQNCVRCCDDRFALKPLS